MTTAAIQIISRTYNKYGEKDFLTRMEGNCPVWCGDKRQALRFTDASDTVRTISTYRDWMCPDGIQGVAVEAA